MVVSILFSGFLALSLTPALCATFLKPVEKGHHHAKRGFFGWFNRGFDRTARGYGSVVSRIVGRAGRYMVIYLALLARSEEHTSELQSLMRISYDVFCLK